MPTPTEPGLYLWRISASGEWCAVRVEMAPDPELWPQKDRPEVLCVTTDTGDFRVGQFSGEWGPRIPSPERLEAMETVLAALPDSYAWELYGGCTRCRFCHAPVLHTVVIGGVQADCHHKPDCPWLRAQEKGDKP